MSAGRECDSVTDVTVIRGLLYVCLSKNNKTIERIANKIVNPAKIKLLLLKKDEMLLDTFIATIN